MSVIVKLRDMRAGTGGKIVGFVWMSSSRCGGLSEERSVEVLPLERWSPLGRCFPGDVECAGKEER